MAKQKKEPVVLSTPKAQTSAGAAPEAHAKAAAVSTTSPSRFLLKGCMLAAVVAAVVAFTDSKEYFVGDQVNNHVQRKWRSFYRFVESPDKNVDVVLFGNSHASAGFEPYVISMATGTYFYILNSPGSTPIDAYHNLQEILDNNQKPKVAILETSCLTDLDIGLGLEWARIQSFEAKQNSWRKWVSMPQIFSADEWLKTISPTIRNHSFLLTDSARLAYNIQRIGEEKNPDRVALDLGRFSHGQNGLTDTMLAKYDKLGSPVKCAQFAIGPKNVSYLQKLYALCKANNIELMLVTAPAYLKTYDNYTLQKNKILASCNEIKKLKWLDLQMPYDSVKYTPQAFNNEFTGTQHNTNYGMSINSYKLAQFILNNYSSILPNRKTNAAWLNDFAVNELDFAINLNVVPSMKSVKVVARDVAMGNYRINELVTKTDKTSTALILKLAGTKDMPETVNVIADLVSTTGQQSTVQLAMSQKPNVFPPGHTVYFTAINKDARVAALRAVQ